ncbi:MAG: hypothetical protein ABJA98_02840 [Acidobacteriota bacterium]
MLFLVGDAEMGIGRRLSIRSMAPCAADVIQDVGRLVVQERDAVVGVVSVRDLRRAARQRPRAEEAHSR